MDDNIAENIMLTRSKGVLKEGHFVVGPKNKTENTFVRSTEIVSLSVILSKRDFPNNGSMASLFDDLDIKKPDTSEKVLEILNNHADNIRPILQSYSIQYFKTNRDYNMMRIMHESAILGHHTILKTTNNLCNDLIIHISTISQEVMRMDNTTLRKDNDALHKDNKTQEKKIEELEKEVESLISIMEERGLM